MERAPDATEDAVIWSCADDWPQGSGRYGCASNAVYYHDASDTYLLSFYSNESVVEVDRATGDTLWWAGGVDGRLFVLPCSDSQFLLAAWRDLDTPAGTLLVSTHDSAPRAPPIWRGSTQVDHKKARVLTRNLELRRRGASPQTNGDTWRLPNGNTLHTLGSASEIKEVDASGEVVWHVDFGGTQLLGRSEWIEDPHRLLSPAERAQLAP